jgi:hypothetical protein
MKFWKYESGFVTVRKQGWSGLVGVGGWGLEVGYPVFSSSFSLLAACSFFFCPCFGGLEALPGWGGVRTVGGVDGVGLFRKFLAALSPSYS